MKPIDIKTITSTFTFLSSVKKITAEEEQGLKEKCANWTVIGDHLQGMTLEQVEKAMVIELYGKARLGIINRLNTRRQRLLAERENQLIVKEILGANSK